MKFCVALLKGSPLSVMETLRRFVVGDCAMAGRQLKTPLFVLNVVPARGVSSRHFKVCAGRSESVAGFARVRVRPARRVLVPGAAINAGVEDRAFEVFVAAGEIRAECERFIHHAEAQAGGGLVRIKRAVDVETDFDSVVGDGDVLPLVRRRLRGGIPFAVADDNVAGEADWRR